jgi:hypothetical protein
MILSDLLTRNLALAMGPMAFSLILGVGSALPMFSQHAHHDQVSSSSQSGVQVTLEVDGAVNPELIPDDVAYLHFFRVLSKNPRNPDQAFEERRRRAYLHHFFPASCTDQTTTAGPLSEAQILKLLEMVDSFVPKLEAASKRLAPQPQGATPGEAGQQMRQMVLAAAADLPNSIDPDAAAKIGAHVRDHMKKNIRLVFAQVPYPSR